jgi:hypothetical protein
MRTTGAFLLTITLAFGLAGCVRSGPPGLVCVPANPPPPYAVAESWLCQAVSVSLHEPGPQIVQHRTGQFADLIVSAVGRCPDRPGQFAPSVTVKNIGPVPAGAFNVEVDISVFDAAGTPAVTTGAVVRVPGLAAGTDGPVSFNRMQGVALRAGDRVSVTVTADPPQIPGGIFNVYGEVLELDETNNSAAQACVVPAG